MFDFLGNMFPTDAASSRVCPECGAPVSDGRFCASCGNNLGKLDRLPTQEEWEENRLQDEAEAARQATEWEANRLQNEAETARQAVVAAAATQQVAERARQTRLLKVGGASVMVLVLIAAAILLPFGPDVDEAEFRASVLAVTQADAPPSSDASPVKSFECTHGTFSTARWTCKLRQDLSLLPDVEVTYDIELGDDGCWRGSENGETINPSAAFLPSAVSGCVAPAAARRAARPSREVVRDIRGHLASADRRLPGGGFAEKVKVIRFVGTTFTLVTNMMRPSESEVLAVCRAATYGRNDLSLLDGVSVLLISVLGRETQDCAALLEQTALG